jgi:anti-sigma factor RsiW
MNCRRIEQLLSEHLEGLVSEREVGAMEAHLEHCPACRRLRQELLAVRSGLRKLAQRLPNLESDIDHQAIDRWLTERAEANGSWRRQFHTASAVIPSALRRGRRPLPARSVWGLALGATVAALLLAPLTFSWWGHDQVAGRRRPTLATRSHPWQIALPVRPAFQPSRERPGHEIAVLQAAPVSERSNVRRSPAPSPVDRAPGATVRHGTPLSADDLEQIEARLRHIVRVRDDFVQIPFPRIVSTSDQQIAAAVESYQREAAIVDPRLAHPVTLQQKATALSDLCEKLRADTDIQLAAGSSVADEKVTLFCEKLPLRDVMRQLSRPFGYAWLRSRKEGEEYRYELVQDLRSQLLEEELRNRDRREALLALDREMERCRPYLGLSPDEVLARAKTAPPAEKPLLEKLTGDGWGPIQMYFRISPGDLSALRSGQALRFVQEPGPGEQLLPPELARGVLQSGRDIRVRDDRGRGGRLIPGPIADKEFSDGLPVASVPEVRVRVFLQIRQSELGQFTFRGISAFLVGNAGTSRGREWAAGMSPTVLNPENARANARWAGDPALRARITVKPQPSCRPAPAAGAVAAAAQEPRVTSADVLEALHRASGFPVVSDYYTRLSPAAAVSVQNLPLMDALNRAADAMRLRWNREGSWLQLRSASYYDDRLKEVPNRLLARWADSRRQHGGLTLEDLIEVAQLTDVQLNSDTIAEGVRECFDLVEWGLARSGNLRPHLRYLASLTPAQLQMATCVTGLPFSRLSLPQQQRLISHLGSRLHSLEELSGAIVRVEYNQPGGFRWAIPQASDTGRGFFGLSPVRERTREAALAAAHRIDPKVDAAQIAPTELELAVVYIVVNPQSGKAMELGTRSTAQGGKINW